MKRCYQLWLTVIQKKFRAVNLNQFNASWNIYNFLQGRDMPQYMYISLVLCCSHGVLGVYIVVHWFIHQTGIFGSRNKKTKVEKRRQEEKKKVKRPSKICAPRYASNMKCPFAASVRPSSSIRDEPPPLSFSPKLHPVYHSFTRMGSESRRVRV